MAVADQHVDTYGYDEYRVHILDGECWCNPTVEYVEAKRGT